MLIQWYYFFFFSSRRRHTRLQGDWSSDVCSSDLAAHPGAGARRVPPDRRPSRRQPASRASSSSTTDGSSLDRKSTRLNSSHLVISYAVFCLKKKKLSIHTITYRCDRTITLPRPDA